jgi:hypothetical protein
MQPSNTKHLGIAGAKRLPTRAAGRCGRRHPLHDKGFPCSAKGNSWNPRPHHHHRTAQGLGDRPPPPPSPVGRSTTLDATKAREAACGRAVIRLAAVYTGRAPRANSRPGHNPDGDTANHAELVAIHAAIADARKSTSLPVTDCAAAIDQIINGAPTGETHLPPPQSPASTHLRPSEKRADRQQGPIEL